jgi:undecaprenyl-diphosphatase
MIDFIYTVDYAVLNFIQEHIANPVLDAFMRLYTHLGDHGLFMIAVACVLMIFKKTRKAAITAAIALVLVFCIGNFGIKPLVGRVRPYVDYTDLIPLGYIPTDLSFPSGHTSTSFAVALVLQRMIPNKFSVPLIMLATLISLSRLYNCVHYPTDVLCGFLLAYIVSQIVSFVAIKVKKNPGNPGQEKVAAKNANAA